MFLDHSHKKPPPEASRYYCGCGPSSFTFGGSTNAWPAFTTTGASPSSSNVNVPSKTKTVTGNRCVWNAVLSPGLKLAVRTRTSCLSPFGMRLQSGVLPLGRSICRGILMRARIPRSRDDGPTRAGVTEFDQLNFRNPVPVWLMRRCSLWSGWFQVDQQLASRSHSWSSESRHPRATIATWAQHGMEAWFRFRRFLDGR